MYQAWVAEPSQPGVLLSADIVQMPDDPDGGETQEKSEPMSYLQTTMDGEQRSVDVSQVETAGSKSDEVEKTSKEKGGVSVATVGTFKKEKPT